MSEQHKYELEKKEARKPEQSEKTNGCCRRTSKALGVSSREKNEKGLDALDKQWYLCSTFVLFNKTVHGWQSETASSDFKVARKKHWKAAEIVVWKFHGVCSHSRKR